MDSRIQNMLAVALMFSWPVVLSFAGKVPAFQVFVGTAVSGLIYFVINARLGYMEVGTISFVPIAIITVCGLMNAYGIEKYIPLLATPKYAGGALALTNMMVAYGTGAVLCYFHKQSWDLSPTNIAGGFVVAIGTVMLTWK